MRRVPIVLVAVVIVVASFGVVSVAIGQPFGTPYATAYLKLTGGTVSGATTFSSMITASLGLESKGAGTCSAADSVVYDNNGVAGCQKLTDVAPQSLMLRPQPAFAGGTQTAADIVACGGQDESKITIGTAANCGTDAVTFVCVDSNGAATTATLTEGTDWTKTDGDNSATATSLAAAIEASACGSAVAATTSSAVVRVALESATCRVALTSSSDCLTETTGTDGIFKIPAGTTGSIQFAAGSGLGMTTGTPTFSASNSAIILTSSPASSTTIAFAASAVSVGSNSSQVAYQMSNLTGYTVSSSGTILTAGTMTGNTVAYIRTEWTKLAWTNAMVVALGAATTGNVLAATLPAKTLVKRAIVVIATAAAGTTTLTISCGRTAAGYIDYVVASDAQAAANTVYGDAIAEVGTTLKDSGATAPIDDLPSYTGTTAINCQFVSTGSNLDQVTTSTGNVFLQTELLP